MKMIFAKTSPEVLGVACFLLCCLSHANAQDGTNNKPSRPMLVALPAKPIINDLYQDKTGKTESTGMENPTDKLVENTATDTPKGPRRGDTATRPMLVALPAKPIINDLYKDKTGKTESTGMENPTDKLVENTDTPKGPRRGDTDTATRPMLVALPAKTIINDLYKDRTGKTESTDTKKPTDKLVKNTATDTATPKGPRRGDIDTDTNTTTPKGPRRGATTTPTDKRKEYSQSENSLILGVSNVIRAFFGDAKLTGVEPQQQTPRPHNMDQIAKIPAKSSPAPNDVKPRFHRKFSGKKRGLGDMAVPLDRVRVISEKPRMLPTIRRVHPGPTMS